MCGLKEPLFACNILCLSGFSGKADERWLRTGKCTISQMRSVPAVPCAQGGSDSRSEEQKLSKISAILVTKREGQVEREAEELATQGAWHSGLARLLRPRKL